jgi:hypothetical protein
MFLFLFKLLSLQYTKRRSWKNGAEPYTLHKYLKSLARMHKKKCKINAQKDKELNLRMQEKKKKMHKREI